MYCIIIKYIRIFLWEPVLSYSARIICKHFYKRTIPVVNLSRAYPPPLVHSQFLTTVHVVRVNCSANKMWTCVALDKKHWQHFFPKHISFGDPFALVRLLCPHNKVSTHKQGALKLIVISMSFLCASCHLHPPVKAISSKLPSLQQSGWTTP